MVLSQIQTDVQLLAFLTAVVVFFNGILISQFNYFDIKIKVPISFLIISTFGFLYPTLILANASQEIINRRREKAHRHILYGYVISEYLGIYLFVLAIPLIINVITQDLYLRLITLIVTILGFIVYQLMNFSIMEVNYPKGYRILSILMILFCCLLFFAQLANFYFIQTSIIFLAFMVLLTIFALKNGKLTGR